LSLPEISWKGSRDVFRQGQFAEFELRIHEMAEKDSSDRRSFSIRRIWT